MYEIIVGVDGSEPSTRALQYAMEEASRHADAAVLVVHAHRSASPRNRYTPAYSHMPAGTLERVMAQQSEVRAEQETIARQQADRVVQTALRSLDGKPADVVIKMVVVARDAARTLIDMSEHADLVVVGSRGKGGFHGLRVGSVSQKVIAHAHCTVAVVR
jgi:nucleotide-binding universal stress UspA family protein